MTETVHMAEVGENISAAAVLGAVIQRVDTVGKVLAAEADWMNSVVGICREIDDENIDYMLEQGRYDEAEAAEKRADDSLVTQRVQTDTHLRNISLAVAYLSDISTVLSHLLPVVTGEEAQ